MGENLPICGKNGTFAAGFYINLLAKSMLKQYETVFISTPVLSDAQVKETVNKYKDLITQAGGEIVHEESWGLKKLAYPIQKKTTGFYQLLEFKAEGEFIDRLETQFRRDERIIRFLTVLMDKYAIEYAEKRRSKIGEGDDERKEKEDA